MGAVPLGAAGLGADVALQVERTTSGAMRVSCPDAPGWAMTVRTPHELARALDAGWREAAVAQYAERKAEPYDLALHDVAAAEAVKTGRLLPVDVDERERALRLLPCAMSTVPSVSTATYDPMLWRMLDDGRWVSPGGRTYGRDTQVVRRIMAKRAEAGIDTPA